MVRSVFAAWFLFLTISGNGAPVKRSPLIGETENVYTLAKENKKAVGLAFDNVSSEAPRLFVLDRSGRIFTYKFFHEPKKGIDRLGLVHVFDLPRGSDGSLPKSPRGLSFAMEEGKSILYFLNWNKSKSGIKSQLWRCNFKDRIFSAVDLSHYYFRIGDREIMDLSSGEGKIFICFDASGYTNHDLRVMRGIVELKWKDRSRKQLEFVKHMPDSGTMPSRGVAFMELEGAPYLWATVGGDYLYSADALTGRGLFYFNRPGSASKKDDSCLGLAFGAGDLWVPEAVSGPDHVCRVNVTRNLDEFVAGPRIVRHLIMTIRTGPKKKYENKLNPGTVYHYYSRPYANNQLHNQGTWPETEKVFDVSEVPNSVIKKFTYDPAGDVSSRQHMVLVEYSNAPARRYSSRYEIDIWTNSYKKFIYPHRVNKNQDALAGTNYLEDDDRLFNLSDTRTYDGFFERVKAHIRKKYNITPRMDNPYWAARNSLEYIQDNYYYPGRAKGKPAAVDYKRKHYDANPGNKKIELSSRDYDKSQIIACSGTSVMLAGAMRYLKMPGRWLGTGTELGPQTWDVNGNGLLDKNETAYCSNGHRYSQVWLGNNYGWICFDATPSRPLFNDYDPPPPLRTQWRYMTRSAAGHRTDKRIVFNVGSRLFMPLFRDFEYDKRLAVDNNCGGDQRYNLQGRFDHHEFWNLASQRIMVKSICFITDVKVSLEKSQTGEKTKKKAGITWKLKGSWDKDPGAELSICLKQETAGTNLERSKLVAQLVKAVPYDSKVALVDLSNYRGKHYRILLRKNGDPETGCYSESFDLK